MWRPRRRKALRGEKTALTQRVGKSIGILTIEQLIQGVVTAGTAVVVARSLGPTDFGLFSFATSAAAMVLPLLSVGQTLLVRDLVMEPSRRNELLAAAFRVAFGIACALQILALGFAVLIPSKLGAVRVPLVLCGLALLARPMLVLDFWFQARLDARGAATARLTGLAVGSALRIAVVIHGGSHVLVLLALTTIVDTVVAGALMVWRFGRSGGPPRIFISGSAPTWTYCKRIAPLLIGGLAVALYVRLDQILLGIMSDPRSLGQYAVAVRLSELLYFVPVVVMSSVAPALTAMHSEDETKFRATYEGIVATFVGIAIAGVVLLSLLAPILIPLVFGDDFGGATGVFRVHVLSLPFVFLGMSQSVWNAVYDQQRLAMWRTLGGVVINVVLCLALIPAYGAMGAAYATVGAYGFAGMLGNALSKETRPYLSLQARQFAPRHLVKNVVLLQRNLKRVREREAT